jgi:hypothetical protein
MLCTKLTSFSGQMADFCIKIVQCPGSNTREFPLQSTLQGVIICIKLHLTLTPCSVYLPAATSVATAALISLIYPNYAHLILLGDFNARNIL